MRTPVAIKCASCAGVRGSSARDRARRLAIPVLVGLALVGLAAFLSSSVIQGSREETRERTATTVAEAGIGQPAKDGPLSFAVTGFRCQGKELEGARRALGRFCLLDIKVRNEGAQSEEFITSLQVLKDAEGNRYDVEPQLIGGAPAPRPGVVGLSQRMNPRTEIERVLAFDVPEEVMPTTAEFHARRGSIGVRVRLSGPEGA